MLHVIRRQQDSLALPFDDKLGADEDDNMDEEEDDSADGADVNFNVTVTKGASSLVFECISDGTYVDVRHVSLEPAGMWSCLCGVACRGLRVPVLVLGALRSALPPPTAPSMLFVTGGLESETSYTGPVFAELDEQLQSGFRDYLQVRPDLLMSSSVLLLIAYGRGTTALALRLPAQLVPSALSIAPMADHLHSHLSLTLP